MECEGLRDESPGNLLVPELRGCDTKQEEHEAVNQHTKINKTGRLGTDLGSCLGDKTAAEAVLG